MDNFHLQEELEDQENPFALSIGDLMAALLLIFILFLASTLLRLQDEYAISKQVAEDYIQIQEGIYDELMKEFRDDLKDWNAHIDPDELTFRFTEPDVLFETNQFQIKPEFEEKIGRASCRERV